MADMGHPDRAMPRGSILGVVRAGERAGELDADPVFEETPPESLFDELGVRATDYFLRVQGLSMKEAGIVEGDLVQVRPIRPGTAPPDGTIVLAEIDIRQAVGESTGRIVIKRFFRQGPVARLQPANRSMEPQEYELDDVVVLGRVVNVIRQFLPK
jgi:SOS-response transcriptional repressor LexA